MLGDIAPFATGIVQFSTHANCSSPLGIAACERAYLTPNNNCYLPIGYDSSDIDIHSHCVGDTIVMTVKNRASRPMNHQGSIIIFEDEIIQRVDSFILYAGESNTFKYLVSTNSTWTAILHQHPAHPTQPILIRENDRCALTVPVKTNIIIPHFPRYDDAASYEENCMIIQGSFDPNLKSVKPVGMFDQHYVAPSQTVSYRIDFQNTGSDTAFGVAVVDTLSPYLDIQSFIAGNASHPYHTEILSNHILKFIFDPIALPDSTNSEINSHGYVQFKIKPITSLPPSTIITNNAAIYFDFNEAVITNAVYNTIYDTVQMFTTIDEVVKNSQPSLIVFPNPAFQQFYLQFDKVIEAATIHIYNSEGKTLLTQSLMQSSGTEIKTSNFKAGIYLISCTTKSGEIWTRKIIIQ